MKQSPGEQCSVRLWCEVDAEEQGCRSRAELSATLRDPRYDMLLRDLSGSPRFKKLQLSGIEIR